MKKSKVLPGVRPNAGLEVLMRQKLVKLVDEMCASVEWWVGAAYKANEPIMAMDAVPAAEIEKVIKELTERWTKRFDEAALKLAKYFAQSVHKRSDAQLRAILRDGGFSVKFKMSRAMRDVMKATIAEQVGLIKSIPQKYLLDVQGDVMRSVKAGRDVNALYKDLRKHYSSTKKRAALIARDQNNKATASMNRVRQVELGLKAKWMHSHGGNEPRRTHLANDGMVYDPTKGWFDPDPKVRKYIWPGELINCRCFSKSVVPGFS
jgi:SPP1 gp7 family putative phage head morphogenesis protein